MVFKIDGLSLLMVISWSIPAFLRTAKSPYRLSSGIPVLLE